MKQIIVASDSHSNHYALEKLVAMYPNAIAYLHAGDSEEDEASLFPFISVKGNNDYLINDEVKILNFPPLKIYMTHSHKMYRSIENMVRRARLNNCNMFIYGHTHKPFYEVCDGIMILNPGSLAYPRTPLGETYAIINIADDDKIDVIIKQFE